MANLFLFIVSGFPPLEPLLRAAFEALDLLLPSLGLLLVSLSSLWLSDAPDLLLLKGSIAESLPALIAKKFASCSIPLPTLDLPSQSIQSRSSNPYQPVSLTVP